MFKKFSIFMLITVMYCMPANAWNSYDELQSDFWDALLKEDEIVMMKAIEQKPDIMEEFAHCDRDYRNLDAVHLTHCKTPLYWALKFRKNKSVKFLLDNGADPNSGCHYEHGNNRGVDWVQLVCSGGRENAAPLEEAIYDKEMVKLLLAKGAKTGFGDAIRNLRGDTRPDKKEILELLLANANDDAITDIFIKNVCDTEVVKRLLAKGLDVNVELGGYSHALVRAAKNECKDSVELLLANGGSGYKDEALNAIANDYWLKIATTEGLEKYESDEEKSAYWSKMAMTNGFWKWSGKRDIANLLLANGAVYSEEYIGNMLSPKGLGEIIESLHISGADINARDEKGETIFMKFSSVARKHTTDRLRIKSSMEVLLANGADVNAKDNEGRTALMYAIKNKHYITIDLLLANGADVNAKDNEGRTALMYAYDVNDQDTMKLLLAKGADVNAKDNEGKTLLMKAIDKGRNGLIEFLLANGADIKADIKVRDEEGKTLLMKAVDEGGKEMVELLLAKGADINARDKDGKTALICAADKYADRREIVELLLAKGADINAKDKEGKTALMKAVVHKEKGEIVKLLLAKGADINTKDKEGKTALMYAVGKQQNEEIVKLLLAKGADVNAKDNEGKTVFDLKNGNGIKELLSEAKSPFIMQSWWKKATVADVENVIKRGADVNSRDEKGRTALIYAAIYTAYPKVIDVLIKAGADVNAKDKDGKTALMYAVGEQNEEMVKLLLAKGADIDAKDKDGYTALMRAIAKRYSSNTEEKMEKLVKLFLAKGADVNARDNKGETVLMHAVKTKNEKIVRWLVAKGADVKAKMQPYDYTALMIASQDINCNPEVVRFLIKVDSDVKTKKKYRERILFSMDNVNTKLKDTDIYQELKNM